MLVKYSGDLGSKAQKIKAIYIVSITKERIENK